MEVKLAQFDNKGMYKDSSISKSSNEFAYHNNNIRITAIGEESLLSITNEKCSVKKDILTSKTLTNNILYFSDSYVTSNVRYAQFSSLYKTKKIVPMNIIGDFGKVYKATVRYAPGGGVDPEEKDYSVLRPGSYYNPNTQEETFIWKLQLSDERDLYVLKPGDYPNLQTNDQILIRLTREEVSEKTAEELEQYIHIGNDYYDDNTDRTFATKPFKYSLCGVIYKSNEPIRRSDFEKRPFNVILNFPTDQSLLTVNYEIIKDLIQFDPTEILIGAEATGETLPYPDDITISGISVEDQDTTFHYIDKSKQDLPPIEIQLSEITGDYIGHCVTSDYIILFVTREQKDYIYRIVYDSEQDKYKAKQLFVGNLGFSTEHPIETLFYYESEDIQKVYWIDGVHQTRVINIMKDDYISNDNNQFDFVPNIGNLPKVKIQKEFDATGSFHSGVIQYFITYYNKFGAETNIVWSSSLHYIAPRDRGGAPDEFISCSFNISITDLDKSFDYIRIYSAKRQSLDGPIEVNVVDDISIKDRDSVDIIDRGTSQQALDSNIIYYLGGSNFIAGTFAQKDDTLFLGNIKLNDVNVSQELKDYIRQNWISNGSIKEANRISFDYKCFSEEEPNKFYVHRQQINSSSISFKGFKRGEIYRFAIQYRTKNGSWTQPIWIGDKKCTLAPKRFDTANQIMVATAIFSNDTTHTEYVNLVSDYIAYRILLAKTDTSTRSILAQGIVCPTMFNYDQRIHNRPFTISSYIMRPRGANTEYRHFYPTDDAFSSSGLRLPENISDGSLVNPGAGENIVLKFKVLVKKAMLGLYWVYKTEMDLCLYLEDAGTHEPLTQEFKIDSADDYSSYGYDGAYNGKIKNKLTEYNLNGHFTKAQHKEMQKENHATVNVGWNRIWYDTSATFTQKMYHKEVTVTDTSPIYQEYLKLYDTTQTDDRIAISKLRNNEYYVDESIVTFNSPDLMSNYYQIDKSDLKFRIVGISPITANKSDFDITFDQNSVAENHGDLLTVPDYYNINNISAGAKTLIKDYLYKGVTVDTGHISDLDKYYIYMWHHAGSIIGDAKDSDNKLIDPIDVIESKTFSTERFSICTEYFDNFPIKISNPQIFNSDGISLLRIGLNGFGSTYYGNYKNILSPINGEQDVTHENMDSDDTVKTSKTTSITYNCKPHAVFALFSDSDNKLALLPKLSSDSSYHDYLDYSFMWNDDNQSPEQAIDDDDVKKGNCFCITAISQGSSEQTIIDRVLANAYHYWDDYHDSTLDNFVFVSTNSMSVAYPIIYGIYKVEETGVGDDRFTCTKLTDFDEYVFKISSNHWYSNVKRTKIVNGDEVPIWYSINNYTGEMSDMTAYLTNTYRRCNTINYSCSYPYLFIGELYRELPYQTLYGGYEENAIENISWIPASEEKSIFDDTNKMEGDTYFQRWDCVKTTPQSLGDLNRVIDITSVMIESHICLDGRFDRNRTSGDILNIDDNNFNLLNDVYSQQNNIFSYNILDDKYDLDLFQNQILWSKQKDITGDIDTWTNISQLNSIYLNGEYGPITKLVNFNDTIIAFQDRAIASIKFNNDIQVSTENGLPIEVVNSNKVTGYNYITMVNGAKNKWSIHQTTGGLYFIDDLNKSLLRLSKDGLNNLSKSCGFSQWFKDNISGDEWRLSNKAFRISSDKINHDVYITKNDTNGCLCYNEDTQTFTSFYSYSPYVTSISMFNLNGKSLLLNRDLGVYHMFEGDYIRDFSVEYKINPEPLEEKIFTNIEYISDTINDSVLLTSNPFKTLSVRTEYQEGSTDLLRTRYPNSNAKFRIWRADIPRDRENPLNRIHNPWINLKLIGNDNIEGITTLHSLVVKYFK